MKKIILIIVAVLVTLGLIGYFAIMPGVLAKKFETANKSAYEDAQKAVEKTRDNFEKKSVYKNEDDASTSDDADDQIKEIEDSQSDVEDAQKKVEDGKAALKKADPGKWPLISNMGKLKKANETAKKLDEFYSKSDKFLKEFTAINEYLKANSEISKEMLKGFEDLETSADETEIVTSLEKVVDEMEKGVKKIKDVDAPDSLKEYKNEVDDTADKLVKLMNDFVAAYKAEDSAKITEVGAEIEKLTSDETTKKLWKEFREKSDFKNLMDDTEDLEKDINF